MKRTLLALAATSVVTGALAQSTNVTLFGVADASVAHISTSGNSVTGMANGGNSSSRLGFRGVEDLGNGLKAGFWLEAGVSVDNGGSVLKFDRRSTISLMGDFGEVRLGRDKSPTYQNLETFHAFGDSGMGAVNGHNLISSSAEGTIEGSNPKRYSDSISYLMPKMGGLYGQATYAFGERAKGDSNSLASSMGLRLGYANGPLNVALGYGVVKGGTVGNTINYKNFNVGASYKFGSITPMVLLASERGNNQRVDLYSVGVKAPVGQGGQGEVRAAVSWYKDKKRDERDSVRLALGYGYKLSKRTEIYASVAHMSNDNNANRKLGTSLSHTVAAGKNVSGYELGLRHTF
ncbi:MAG: porin [Comamonas sp.]|nr:porin [Comamonas sp.]